jgi:NAD(P)H-hydrate epimerase
MKVASVEEIANLDKRASEEYGITPILLMENAGNAVYTAIDLEFGIKDNNFIIVAGPGNNGGDGFVVARKLYSSGGNVKVFILGDPTKYRGEARENYIILNKLPIEKHILRSSLSDNFYDGLEWSDIIVDAIFGTGLKRKVGGVFKEAIDAINETNRIIFSVDIPSGVNGNDGRIMGTAVIADYTVTFGLPKTGLFLYPGAEYVGKLYLSHISYPRELVECDDILTELNIPYPPPPRREDTHKGSYGKALFIAGSTKYLGAPYLSSLSYLKAGGGLSYLATVKSISTALASEANEVVILPLDETVEGSIAYKNIDYLIEYSNNVDFVIIGPGLSLNEETQELVRDLCIKIKKPILIDGDGITAISNDPTILCEREEYTILTPHMGEMSRITKLDINTIKRDKLSILRKYAKKLNSTIVLKGANSLVGYSDGRIYINLSGNPGMATAGSGDVLTGAIAAMYGIGYNIDDAVRIGVFIHGLAGDLAANEIGMDGIIARDIMEFLPDAMIFLRENIEEIIETSYYKLQII